MNFVLVQVYTNYIDANIILGRLQNEEINCWLKDENTVTIDPILTNAIGGIKLMVAEPQAEKAISLLRQYKNEQQQNTKCPVCNSTNVELVSTPRKTLNWLWAILGYILVNYAIAADKVYHCFDCGHEYPPPEPDTEE
jgi:hypothetical protein